MTVLITVLKYSLYVVGIICVGVGVVDKLKNGGRK
jgi:hypothetical protein